MLLRTICSASLFAGVMTIGGGAIEVSCTPAQGQAIESQLGSDALGDVECVVAQLLQGALTDPLQILANCGQLVISQLITLAEDLLAIPLALDGGADAATPAFKPKMLPPHLANIVLTDVQRSRIQVIHDAAIKLTDAGQ
jgi:hypothetical protein